MKLRLMFFLLQILCLFVFVTPQSRISETQKSYLDFEKQFLMIWSYNSSHITFELQVNTTGWIGIGFSQNGNMANADIHLGWVNNGIAHITDRHGLGYNGYPPLDDEQNVELLKGWECDGFTFLKFVRQLAACEEMQDRPITTDTMRMIYAYGDVDPDDDWSFNKHSFEHRGAKSLYIFEPQEAPEIPEANVLTFDLFSDNASLPMKSTYYKCILYELPQLNTKHHIVRIEPIIRERFRANLHHMIVHLCVGLKNSSAVGYSEECYIRDSHPDLKQCNDVFGGWAVGGGTIVFPDHVGFPIGEPGGTKYVKLEIHYDNPELIEINDDSGMRFHYTSSLRQHDAGSLNIGTLNNGLFLIIPPKTDSYKVYAGCDSACLGGAMDFGGTESINIFTSFLHSHLAGRKLKLTHIRNGTELPNVVQDDNYDFNYQQPRILAPETVVKKGDDLQVVCDYSSTFTSHPVVGGLDTTKEMCTAFLLYYPRIPVSTCASTSAESYRPFMSAVGVEKVKRINLDKEYSRVDLSDLVVTSPQEMANQTLKDAGSNYKWTQTSSDYLSEYTRLTTQYQLCLGTEPLIQSFSFRGPLVITNPIQKDLPESGCVVPSSGFPTNLNATTCDIPL